MKEILRQFAAYNIWANQKIIETLLKLPQSDLNKEVDSSFNTLTKTVYHVWSAEAIWIQRLALVEHPDWVEKNFSGSFKESTIFWQKVSKELMQFVEKQYNDAAFEHVVQYNDRKGQMQKNRVGDVLLHVFNHSTFHRGQMITQLRQVGAKTIPNTDLIAFARLAKK
ncbi:MAG: DinB family protein [Bacteroidetes bacterium]|nr:DinB family protein [Bacteroidota bacterium]